MLSAKLFVGVLLFCSLNSGLAKKNKHECYVDEEGDKEDPNNIYSCNESEKCCHEEGKPSCCKAKETEVAVMEQVKIWGTLAGVIVLIALLMFCFRNDGDCCWDRKDGGRYKYCCCGPIIYREGKGPDMKPECIYRRFDDEEDHQEKVNHHDPSLKRPEGAPPPYQDSQMKNVNEINPHEENKSPRKDNNDHNENSNDHQKDQNDHETHPKSDEHNDPAGSNQNHSEDHQQNQDQSQQPSDHQPDQDKPKEPEGDLISFNND